MKPLYLACVSAFVFSCTAAYSFELEKVLILDIENINAQANAIRMIEDLCPNVEDASICKLEFEVALKQFAVVGNLLKRAAIAHPGEQRQRFVVRARNAFERGELLYQLALVQNTPVASSDLMDAAKQLAKQPE